MGKPFNDQGGSGFHVHLSLVGDDGRNAFDDSGAPHGLGAMRARFVAGLLEHGPALMALLAPTVNAYKRLVPDSLAPTHVNWGMDNRTSFVRVPNEHGSPQPDRGARRGRQRLRRTSRSRRCCSPGLDGIERELEPATRSSGDAYRAETAARRCPRDLGVVARRARGRRLPPRGARRAARRDVLRR